MQALLVVVLAFVVRVVNLDHGQHHDEYYHLLAAQSWAESGTLAIGQGEYTRASSYTILIGELFEIFGPSVIVARMPSVLAGSLMALVLFLWLRHTTNRFSAWTAAVLLIFSPGAIYISQYVRFYAIHNLLFLIGVLLCYYGFSVSNTRTRSAILFGLSALFLYSAFQLQVATLIGLVGILAWVTYIVGLKLVSDESFRGRLTIYLAGLLVILVAGIITVLFTDLTQKYIDLYTQAAPWNAEFQDDLLFYHRLFGYQYPAMWALTPVAAIIAIAYYPRESILCFVLVTVPLLLHSFGGMKHERYITYIVPFWFAIWAIAISAVFPAVLVTISTASTAILGARYPNWLYNSLNALIIILLVVYVIGTTRAFTIAWDSTMGQPYTHKTDWSGARDILRPWVRESELLITTDGLEFFYYLGDFDIVYGYSKLMEVSKEGVEFSIDSRTGKPVISTTGSFELIVNCHQSGLFVGDGYGWNKPAIGLGKELADWLAQFATPIELPQHSNVQAFYWKKEATEIPPHCANLPFKKTRNLEIWDENG